MLNHIKKLFVSSTKTLYPDRCPFCGTLINSNKYACKSCMDDMTKAGIQKGVKGGFRCVSTFLFDGKPKRALIHFKFKNKPQYAKQLSVVMYTEVIRSYEDMIFDVITYVPMHKRSQFFRGYNQCELLAKELSKLLKVPYKPLLIKKKVTKPQHKLKSNKRATNLKGAFDITDKKDIKDKNILLIDDIITTGTTLFECTKTLCKAKPANIYCITLARA